MDFDRAVLVTHPGLQHAHQMALALHEEQLLQAFWSGVPVTEDGGDIPFWLPARYKQRIRTVPIPRARRHHPLRFQLLTRVGGAMPLPCNKSDYLHRVMHAFDAWMARRIERLRPRAVVAYENAAYHTFQAARRIGARCILDAPSLHHVTGDRLMEVPSTPYTAEINRRKDAEVEAADLVLTCSPLAARSYTDNGVAAHKVASLLLGAQLPAGTQTEFRPAPVPRFLFAGVLSYRKSIDVICEVFRRLHADGVPCEVHFVGGSAGREWLEAVQGTPNAVYHPGVPQAQLYGLLAQADCLLLPSRFDSFGMVVAEAMACGTPALVSTQTGAKAIIEQHPGSGWIVAPQADALHAQVRALAQARERLFAARPHARRAADDFTWQSYRQRAGRLLREHLG